MGLLTGGPAVFPSELTEFSGEICDLWCSEVFSVCMASGPVRVRVSHPAASSLLPFLEGSLCPLSSCEW